VQHAVNPESNTIHIFERFEVKIGRPAGNSSRYERIDQIDDGCLGGQLPQFIHFGIHKAGYIQGIHSVCLAGCFILPLNLSELGFSGQNRLPVNISIAQVLDDLIIQGIDHGKRRDAVLMRQRKPTALK